MAQEIPRDPTDPIEIIARVMGLSTQALADIARNPAQAHDLTAAYAKQV